MKGITKLGLLAVAGVAVNELSKSGNTRSANTTAKTVDPDSVKNSILSDPGALNLLKGNKGDAGFGYNATSTSTVGIATGSKSFATQGNLAYSAGARVRVSYATDTTKFMEGVVTSYADATLVVNVDLIGGTGTFADWNINVAGQRGLTGLRGEAGAEIKNFAGGLVKNSSLELLTIEGWTGGELGTDYEGLPTIVVNTHSQFNTNKFFIDNTRLYKITYSGKSSGVNYRLVIRRLDKAGESISQGGDSSVLPLNMAFYNNITFERKIQYFGGTGSVSSAFGSNCVNGQVAISNLSAGLVELSKIVVEKVSLGEPVPYNLSWLPVGQTVYDPTTWKMGLYNGTTIVFPA